MKQKPQTAWAIVNPDGVILPWTVRTTESIAIKQFSKPNRGRWAPLYAQGYRCKKVEIRVIEQEDKL